MIRRICSSRFFLFSLLSVFLIAAGISRYLETDSGNILIHDIEVENFEGYLYGARLFRPLQASSMNRRPSILLVPGDIVNRYFGDHIAMEFARRGFVVLTIEDIPQGTSVPDPEPPAESPIDSAFTFLTTRFFTDPDRTGLITFYTGSGKALAAEHFSDFDSRIFVSPEVSPTRVYGSAANIFTAEYETDPAYRFSDPAAENLTVFPSSHAGMIFHPEVIAALLEQFHEDLAIPNDSPFWFSAHSQRAQVLLILRFLLLPMLMTLCIGINARIINDRSCRIHNLLLAVLVPLMVFLAAGWLMNNFLISVRIGSPFRYHPSIPAILREFSAVSFVFFLLSGLLFSIPLNRHRNFLVSDISAALTMLICIFGFCPVLFSETSGWALAGITKLRWLFFTAAVCSAFYSFLIRISSLKKHYRLCCAVLISLMSYIVFCGLPAGFFS